MHRFLSAFAGLALLFAPTHAAAGIVTFDDLPFASGNFENGANLPVAGSFSSGGATFNNSHGFDHGFEYWSGWAYSRVVDNGAAGFGNQYAAYTPNGGDKSSAYGIATSYAVGDASITLAADQAPVSMRVANTTYAALSMRDGDGFAKKFGGVSGSDPDFFLLTIVGKDANDQTTGYINFYLADYRFDDKFILSDWATVDLTPLGSQTRKLYFGLSSSDNGKYGMNTPAYFAADNLEVAAVPEPSSFALVALGAAAYGLMRKRKQAQRAAVAELDLESPEAANLG
ncbi:MAG: DUF4465 domain-containing protein [Planctomycetota bacterium]